MFYQSLSRALPRLAAKSFGASRQFSSQTSKAAFSSLRYQAPRITTSFLAPRYAAFSTARLSYAKEGQVDQELSAKLESEISIERSMRDSESIPTHLEEFLQSSGFKLQDVEGQEEVVLTRSFGDETVKVTISTADLGMMDEDGAPFGEEDDGMFDEDEASDIANGKDEFPAESAQSGGANSKHASKTGKTDDGNIKLSSSPSSGKLEEDDEAGLPANEDEDEFDQAAFPARMLVSISKANAGTLELDTTADNGEVVINRMALHEGSSVAKAGKQAAKAILGGTDAAASEKYQGPPYTNLDEDLQMLIERYLDERGVNTALAIWVPEYLDFKEQREYLKWLGNVKTFVDA